MVSFIPMMRQFVQMTKSKLIPVVLIPGRESHQGSKLAKEKKAYFLESKFQQQVMTAGDHQELSKGWQPNTLKTLSTKLQTSACPSLPLLCPFPSYFPGSPALSVLNGRAQCSAKEIPSFPSWLTRKLFRSQLFPGGGLTAYRERGRLSLELSPQAGQHVDVGPTTRPQAGSAV